MHSYSLRRLARSMKMLDGKAKIALLSSSLKRRKQSTKILLKILWVRSRHVNTRETAERRFSHKIFRAILLKPDEDDTKYLVEKDLAAVSRVQKFSFFYYYTLLHPVASRRLSSRAGF